MASTSIGVRTVRRVGSRLVVSIPSSDALALGIGEGDRVEVSLRPAGPSPILDPALSAAMEAAWQQIEPGLRHLADR